jgi:phosphoglucosamine mutase
VAHDGDADRFLAVDARGEIVDGDQIIAILALAMRDAGTLKNNTVVSTVMANLGFKIAMERENITVIETAVGDRYVLEAMRDGGFNLGGEQSGHVILSEFATTGDGALTALQLMAQVARSKKTLSELAGVMQRLPQVLINVKGVDKQGTGHPDVVAAVREVEAQLAGAGRVLLRPSGTEPVVRVMVEAATAELAQTHAEHIAHVVRTHLAL